MRNAPELSTTTAPRDAAIGAHSAETSSGTSNIATSIPSNASGESATTVNSSPRHINFLPALRADAIKRISPHTSSRSDKIPSITVPTAPVAPTTASDGFFIVRYRHKQQLLLDPRRVQMQCVLHARPFPSRFRGRLLKYESLKLKSSRYSRRHRPWQRKTLL
ncbi:unannotated protein [freshwater metagenome]|uniref:Unannotated protein n=1 Tax=freshwater metagenome TaxID=449393 RepID=A0A6J7P9S6_9ZZZZ